MLPLTLLLTNPLNSIAKLQLRATFQNIFLGLCITSGRTAIDNEGDSYRKNTYLNN